jgi:hypothetical protein
MDHAINLFAKLILIGVLRVRFTGECPIVIDKHAKAFEISINNPELFHTHSPT